RLQESRIRSHSSLLNLAGKGESWKQPGVNVSTPLGAEFLSVDNYSARIATVFNRTSDPFFNLQAAGDVDLGSGGAAGFYIGFDNFQVIRVEAGGEGDFGIERLCGPAQVCFGAAGQADDDIIRGKDGAGPYRSF